jgi:hypothetical protein
MEGYWVWCGSVVSGEDGRFHMFASRWPKSYAFSPHWLFHCEVVRASSDTPEGPYTFEEIVLPRRGPAYFDGMNTHNPSIYFWEGTYYLYYFGTTYPEAPPVPGEAVSNDRALATWNRKRIGLATSKSVFGPWHRLDRPLMEPRVDKWDCTITTNPTVAILADGTTYMIYKSRCGDTAPLRLGTARAPNPAGPFERLTDEPLFQFDDPNIQLEDPCLWYDGSMFNALVKDHACKGCAGVTGEYGAGVHVISEDCVHWEVVGKAYSRQVRWDDGTTTIQANLERANLLMQGGKPTHLFCATGKGDRPWQFTTTWNMCLPLI